MTVSSSNCFRPEFSNNGQPSCGSMDANMDLNDVINAAILYLFENDDNSNSSSSSSFSTITTDTQNAITLGNVTEVFGDNSIIANLVYLKLINNINNNNNINIYDVSLVPTIATTAKLQSAYDRAIATIFEPAAANDDTATTTTTLTAAVTTTTFAATFAATTTTTNVGDCRKQTFCPWICNSMRIGLCSGFNVLTVTTSTTTTTTTTTTSTTTAPATAATAPATSRLATTYTTTDNTTISRSSLDAATTAATITSTTDTTTTATIITNVLGDTVNRAATENAIVKSDLKISTDVYDPYIRKTPDTYNPEVESTAKYFREMDFVANSEQVSETGNE
ncbi:hypothetical protein HELRODRAFT_181418 [Helobdella robusta]|uniref:Uncharacterized protein n=1 Tax=Helobdella robusta TaxID=6412 RepID=T1FGZ5_HELRO|nr:hypothetical protein HELRODRAFT_181418 [Helobdella robusta]ESN92373.1 hypothetical protein HELRODRAFT_181418 [Helobdella robusta]